MVVFERVYIFYDILGKRGTARDLKTALSEQKKKRGHFFAEINIIYTRPFIVSRCSEISKVAA